MTAAVAVDDACIAASPCSLGFLPGCSQLNRTFHWLVSTPFVESYSFGPAAVAASAPKLWSWEAGEACTAGVEPS